MIILDTNLVSEPLKPEPNQAVLELGCNARKTDVFPLERVDLVSFVLGQVLVGHGAR